VGVAWHAYGLAAKHAKQSGVPSKSPEHAPGPNAHGHRHATGKRSVGDAVVVSCPEPFFRAPPSADATLSAKLSCSAVALSAHSSAAKATKAANAVSKRTMLWPET